MSVNDQTTGPRPARKRPERLRIIGVVILLVGLVAAGAVYWVGTHSSEPSEDELLPGNAKAESRQMEILYGKLGLLTMELSDDLKQPGPQACIIATISILAAAACFYVARLSDDDSETE
jgi:flagellar basal body-associated protein FliL